MLPPKPVQKVFEIESEQILCNQGKALTNSETPLTKMKIGSIIDGRYRIDKMLGQGGMGQVFLAYDRELNKKFALKVLFPHASELVLKRFWVEAKALAALDHPNT
jgi:serine/threonine protein kinase